MMADPHPLGRALDFIGSRLEARHLIGLPLLLIFSGIFFGYWPPSPSIVLLFAGFVAPFFAPRRWLWICFLGWALFAGWLSLLSNKGIFALQATVGAAAVALLAVSVMSYTKERPSK